MHDATQLLFRYVYSLKGNALPADYKEKIQKLVACGADVNEGGRESILDGARGNEELVLFLHGDMRATRSLFPNMLVEEHGECFTVLDISDNQNVTDITLSLIEKHCPFLLELNISNCPMITLKRLREMLMQTNIPRILTTKRQNDELNAVGELVWNQTHVPNEAEEIEQKNLKSSFSIIKKADLSFTLKAVPQPSMLGELEKNMLTMLGMIKRAKYVQSLSLRDDTWLSQEDITNASYYRVFYPYGERIVEIGVIDICQFLKALVAYLLEEEQRAERKGKNVQKLHFELISLRAQHITLLGPLLEKSTMLRELTLECCLPESNALPQIATALKQNKALRSIAISQSSFVSGIDATDNVRLFFKTLFSENTNEDLQLTSIKLLNYRFNNEIVDPVKEDLRHYRKILVVTAPPNGQLFWGHNVVLEKCDVLRKKMGIPQGLAVRFTKEPQQNIPSLSPQFSSDLEKLATDNVFPSMPPATLREELDALCADVGNEQGLRQKIAHALKEASNEAKKQCNSLKQRSDVVKKGGIKELAAYAADIALHKNWLPGVFEDYEEKCAEAQKYQNVQTHYNLRAFYDRHWNYLAVFFYLALVKEASGADTARLPEGYEVLQSSKAITSYVLGKSGRDISKMRSVQFSPVGKRILKLTERIARSVVTHPMVEGKITHMTQAEAADYAETVAKQMLEGMREGQVKIYHSTKESAEEIVFSWLCRERMTTHTYEEEGNAIALNAMVEEWGNNNKAILLLQHLVKMMERSLDVQEKHFATTQTVLGVALAIDARTKNMERSIAEARKDLTKLLHIVPTMLETIKESLPDLCKAVKVNLDTEEMKAFREEISEQLNGLKEEQKKLSATVLRDLKLSEEMRNQLSVVLDILKRPEDKAKEAFTGKGYDAKKELFCTRMYTFMCEELSRRLKIANGEDTKPTLGMKFATAGGKLAAFALDTYGVGFLAMMATGIIVAIHGRIRAARHARVKQIPFEEVLVDLTLAVADAYLLQITHLSNNSVQALAEVAVMLILNNTIKYNLGQRFKRLLDLQDDRPSGPTMVPKEHVIALLQAALLVGKVHTIGRVSVYRRERESDRLVEQIAVDVAEKITEEGIKKFFETKGLPADILDGDAIGEVISRTHGMVSRIKHSAEKGAWTAEDIFQLPGMVVLGEDNRNPDYYQMPRLHRFIHRHHHDENSDYITRADKYGCCLLPLDVVRAYNRVIQEDKVERYIKKTGYPNRAISTEAQVFLHKHENLKQKEHRSTQESNTNAPPKAVPEKDVALLILPLVYAAKSPRHKNVKDVDSGKFTLFFEKHKLTPRLKAHVNSIVQDEIAIVNQEDKRFKGTELIFNVTPPFIEKVAKYVKERGRAEERGRST